MRLGAGLVAARAAGAIARRGGRGGTSLPGKVLTRVDPHAIGHLAARLERGSVVISATNGKTTTAAMVASILDRTGARLVHNRAGANMAGGVASALAGAARRGGRTLDGDLGLFEVDEFWLGPVTEELQPRAMLLGNLFRDQLDRYGELETIAERWAGVVAARGRTWGRTCGSQNSSTSNRPVSPRPSTSAVATPPAMFAPERLCTSVWPPRSRICAAIAAVVVFPFVAERIALASGRARRSMAPGSMRSSSLPGSDVPPRPVRREAAPAALAASSLALMPAAAPVPRRGSRARCTAAPRSGRRRRRP